MTKKFRYMKYGTIQISVEALSQTQIPNTLKYKIKEPKVHKYQIRISNIKYELHKKKKKKKPQN